MLFFKKNGLENTTLPSSHLQTCLFRLHFFLTYYMVVSFLHVRYLVFCTFLLQKLKPNLNLLKVLYLSTGQAGCRSEEPF